MSRKGNCRDNAVSESFFATIKKELIHRFTFTTRREAAAAIFEYMEVFYSGSGNTHSSVTPAPPSSEEMVNLLLLKWHYPGVH